MSADSLFLCPQCRQPLPVRPPCSCGFLLRESSGIINLMTDQESAVVQPFLDVYEQVRRDERWGGDDLDLPFHPRRHRDIWRIRQHTFRKFESVVADAKRGIALDIGAGNCWMTRYLDRWGFDAIALDINTSGMDGLRAGRKFIDEGAAFLRVRSGMERLPFLPERIKLLATNASFHYASDFRTALSEFERVLTPGGMIAIVDSPFYENAADGERMMAERVVEFRRKYGMPETFARRSRYLTYKGLEEMVRSLNLSCQVLPVWPGFRRSYKALRAKFAGRNIAEFPVVVIEKHFAMGWNRDTSHGS